MFYKFYSPFYSCRPKIEHIYHWNIYLSSFKALKMLEAFYVSVAYVPACNAFGRIMLVSCSQLEAMMAIDF